MNYVLFHHLRKVKSRRQIETSHRRMVQAVLDTTWPDSIFTVEHPQRAKLTPLRRTIRKRRLHLIGYVIRMPSKCHEPLGTLLTTVSSNCRLRQRHGRTVALQRNATDDLRSINCDATLICRMIKSCFFQLVYTLD